MLASERLSRTSCSGHFRKGWYVNIVDSPYILPSAKRMRAGMNRFCMHYLHHVHGHDLLERRFESGENDSNHVIGVQKVEENYSVQITNDFYSPLVRLCCQVGSALNSLLSLFAGYEVTFAKKVTKKCQLSYKIEGTLSLKANLPEVSS